MTGINGFGQTGANWTQIYNQLKNKKSGKTDIEKNQQNALNAADTNKDGKIDDKEAQLLNTSENAEKIFTSKDSKEVSDAYKAYNQTLNTAAKRKRANTIAGNLAKDWEDKDGDGKVDVDELSDNNAFFKPLKNIFENLDEQFSMEELVNYFDLMDTNKDGALTTTEQNNFGKLVMNNYDKKGTYSKDDVMSALQKAISNNETQATTTVEQNIINAVNAKGSGSIYNLKDISLPANITLNEGDSWTANSTGTVFTVTSADKNKVKTYDNNGNLTKAQLKSVQNGKNVTNVISRPTKGTLVENADGTFTTTKVVTSGSGNNKKTTTTISNFSAEGTLAFTAEATADKNNNITQVKFTDEVTKQSSTIFDYGISLIKDENGNIIGFKQTSKDGAKGYNLNLKGERVEDNKVNLLNFTQINNYQYALRTLGINSNDIGEFKSFKGMYTLDFEVPESMKNDPNSIICEFSTISNGKKYQVACNPSIGLGDNFIAVIKDGDSTTEIHKGFDKESHVPYETHTVNGELKSVKLWDNLIECPENGTLEKTDDGYQTVVKSGNPKTPDEDTKKYNNKGQLVETSCVKYTYFGANEPHAGEVKEKYSSRIEYDPEHPDMPPKIGAHLESYENSYVDVPIEITLPEDGKVSMNEEFPEILRHTYIFNELGIELKDVQNAEILLNGTYGIYTPNIPENMKNDPNTLVCNFTSNGKSYLVVSNPSIGLGDNLIAVIQDGNSTIEIHKGMNMDEEFIPYETQTVNGKLQSVKLGDNLIECPENGTLEKTDNGYRTEVKSGNEKTPDVETKEYNEKGQLLKETRETYDYFKANEPHAGEVKSKTTTVVKYDPEHPEIPPQGSTNVISYEDSYVDIPIEKPELPSNINLPEGATWEYKDGVYVVTNGLTVSTYNENGNKLEETNGRYKTSYTYDDRGNMLSKKTYYNKYGSFTLDSTIKYTYDNNNNILTKMEYDKNNKLTSSYSYTYDKNGNMLTETLKDSTGTYANTYTYDKNGNLTRAVCKSTEKGKTTTRTLTKPSNGTLVRHSDGTFTTTQTTKSGTNTITTKKDYSSKGNLLLTTQATTDKNNKLTQVKVTDAVERTTRTLKAPAGGTLEIGLYPILISYKTTSSTGEVTYYDKQLNKVSFKNIDFSQIQL